MFKFVSSKYCIFLIPCLFAFLFYFFLLFHFILFYVFFSCWAQGPSRPNSKAHFDPLWPKSKGQTIWPRYKDQIGPMTARLAYSFHAAPRPCTRPTRFPSSREKHARPVHKPVDQAHRQGSTHGLRVSTPQNGQATPSLVPT